MPRKQQSTGFVAINANDMRVTIWGVYRSTVINMKWSTMLSRWCGSSRACGWSRHSYIRRIRHCYIRQRISIDCGSIYECEAVRERECGIGGRWSCRGVGTIENRSQTARHWFIRIYNPVFHGFDTQQQLHIINIAHKWGYWYWSYCDGGSGKRTGKHRREVG